MLNFNVWVCGVNLGGWGGREGGFFMLLFLMLFFRIQSKTPNHFFVKQTEFGRIFSSTTFLKRIFLIAY